MSCHFEPRMNIYKFPDPCMPICPCSYCPPIPAPISFLTDQTYPTNPIDPTDPDAPAGQG